MQADYQWSKPRRQAPAAMLFFTIRYLRKAIRQAWPIFLVLVLRRKSEGWLINLAWVALGITGLQLVFSILTWFRYYYYLENDELVVEKGWLSRKKTSVPLARIQSLQFEQNLLHRQLNVVKVNVETAGSKGTELSLEAIQLDVARALRSFVASHKKELSEPLETTDEGELVSERLSAPLVRPLALVGLPTLLRLGLTQNHLRTAVLILGGLFGIYQLAGDLFQLESLSSVVEQAFGVAPATRSVWLLWGGVLLTIAAILGSMVRAILRYYELKLVSLDEGLQLEAGLLNRREQFMKLHKLQFMKLEVNPLQRILGLRTATLTQASSGELDAKQAMQVPGMGEDQAETLVQHVFGEDASKTTAWRKIHPRVVRRYLIRVGVFPILLVSAFLIGKSVWGLCLVWLWLPMAYLLARRYYERFGFVLEKRLFRIKSHLFLDKQTWAWNHKIQAVKLNQNFFQQRLGVADIELFLAGGSLTIPYLPVEEAHQLRDYFLYQVERSHEAWM